MKPTVSTAPSQRSMVLLVKEKRYSASALRNSVARSTVEMPEGLRGTMTDVRPSMSIMLNTHEPMTLPNAIDVLPFQAATTLVASSGRDVPAPSMVMPITASETPKRLCETCRRTNKDVCSNNKFCQTNDDKEWRKSTQSAIQRTDFAYQCVACSCLLRHYRGSSVSGRCAFPLLCHCSCKRLYTAEHIPHVHGKHGNHKPSLASCHCPVSEKED